MGCVKAKEKSEPKSKVDKEDKEIAAMLVTRDKVRTYNKKLETNVEACKEAVKQCIRSKEKDKALLTLRKQKYMQQQLENGQKSLLQLEQMINDVESARVQQNIYEALKTGNEFLKKLNEAMPLDDVEKLMEDTAEAIAYQQEIGDLLSKQGIAEDDEDILKQFEELDSLEALDYDLPNAPKNKLVKEEPERQSNKHQSREKEVSYA